MAFAISTDRGGTPPNAPAPVLGGRNPAIETGTDSVGLPRSLLELLLSGAGEAGHRPSKPLSAPAAAQSTCWVGVGGDEEAATANVVPPGDIADILEARFPLRSDTMVVLAHAPSMDREYCGLDLRAPRTVSQSACAPFRSPTTGTAAQLLFDRVLFWNLVARVNAEGGGALVGVDEAGGGGGGGGGGGDGGGGPGNVRNTAFSAVAVEGEHVLTSSSPWDAGSALWAPGPLCTLLSSWILRR